MICGWLWSIQDSIPSQMCIPTALDLWFVNIWLQVNVHHIQLTAYYQSLSLATEIVNFRGAATKRPPKPLPSSTQCNDIGGTSGLLGLCNEPCCWQVTTCDIKRRSNKCSLMNCILHPIYRQFHSVFQLDHGWARALSMLPLLRAPWQAGFLLYPKMIWLAFCTHIHQDVYRHWTAPLRHHQCFSDVIDGLA